MSSLQIAPIAADSKEYEILIIPYKINGMIIFKLEEILKLYRLQ